MKIFIYATNIEKAKFIRDKIIVLFLQFYFDNTREI